MCRSKLIHGEWLNKFLNGKCYDSRVHLTKRGQLKYQKTRQVVQCWKASPSHFKFGQLKKSGGLVKWQKKWTCWLVTKKVKGKSRVWSLVQSAHLSRRCIDHHLSDTTPHLNDYVCIPIPATHALIILLLELTFSKMYNLYRSLAYRNSVPDLEQFRIALEVGSHFVNDHEQKLCNFVQKPCARVFWPKCPSYLEIEKKYVKKCETSAGDLLKLLWCPFECCSQ